MSDGCSGAAPLQLISIDGPTGVWAWHAVAGPVCTPDEPQIAVRHDGAVAVVTPGNISGFPNLMLLDGATGAPMSVPTIPTSTFTSVNGQLTQGYSRVGPPMIDVDGTVHLLYEQRFLAYPPQVVDTAVWLMSVHPNGSSTTTQLATTTANVNLFPGRIIPDGAGGLIASWIDSPVVPAGQPPAQSTFRAARIPAGGGVVPFDLPLTPPFELLHPANTVLPTSPELVLGEQDRAFVSYSNMVAGFHIATGSPSLSYAASSAITMLAATADGGLVAKTNPGSGIDTVLSFPVGGGVHTSTLGVGGIEHMVKDVWTSTSIGAGAGLLNGENIDWASSGWFSPDQGGTKASIGHFELVNTNRLDPHQSQIRSAYVLAKAKLEQDPLLPNPTCSTWFNSGLAGGTAADWIQQTLLQVERFAHAEFKRGGSLAGGDDTSAFAGGLNADRSPVAGIDATAAIHFNRRGAFFQSARRVGPYPGGTPRAQLTVALHELAHLMQDIGPPTSAVRVPGFSRDGQSNKLSEANTALILKMCRTAIERP